MQRLREMGYF